MDVCGRWRRLFGWITGARPRRQQWLMDAHLAPALSAVRVVVEAYAGSRNSHKQRAAEEQNLRRRNRAAQAVGGVAGLRWLVSKIGPPNNRIEARESSTPVTISRSIWTATRILYVWYHGYSRPTLQYMPVARWLIVRRTFLLYWFCAT